MGGARSFSSPASFRRSFSPISSASRSNAVRHGSPWPRVSRAIRPLGPMENVQLRIPPQSRGLRASPQVAPVPFWLVPCPRSEPAHAAGVKSLDVGFRARWILLDFASAARADARETDFGYWILVGFCASLNMCSHRAE